VRPARAPAASVESSRVRVEMHRRAMVALSGAHFTTDFAGGALPALVPFIHDRFHLNYLLSAVLILASSISSSVIQPLFGLWSDRRGALWLMPVGVGLSGLGIALAADAPRFWLVVGLVVVSGVGVAAFHPEGAKFAAYASGARRASGMSVFSVGGNVGFALGPAVTAPLVIWLGLRGGLLLALPGLVVAGLFLAAAPALLRLVPERRPTRQSAGADHVGAMVVLITMIACRSLTWFGLITFVPLWERAHGHSRGYGDLVLTIMLASGAVGTMLLGPVADRVGGRRVMIATQALVCPLALVFVLVGGIPGVIALAPLAGCVVGTFGVTLVLSQQYLPRHIGMASGLTAGLSIGLGGVAAVGLGAIGDTLGLRTALLVAAAAPLAGLALATKLPPTGRPLGGSPPARADETGLQTA
jgi:FSR family fosmidomycin resistance protein-like MFS transporter